MRTLLPGDADLAKMAVTRTELSERFAHLTKLDFASPAPDEPLEEIEGLIAKMQSSMMELDADIPMGWFRQNFETSVVTPDAIADYASLIGATSGEEPARLDRVQFLLTRVVRTFLGDASNYAGANLRNLLAEALPPSSLDAKARDTAVRFLRDAARRAGEFKAFKELVDSGFFVDTRGYKLSLRRSALDPDVMAAIIELNEATSAAIDRLARRETAEGKDLAAHLKQVDERLKQLFKGLRTDDSLVSERFKWRIAKNKGGPTEFETYLKKQGKSASGINISSPRRRQAVMLTVIVMGAVLLYFQTSSKGRLVELAPKDALTISPLLSNAGVSPPDQPKVLIGHIDKARWAAMNGDGRHQAAEQMANKLRERGLISATVLLEDQVVIQIENGKLLLVQ